MSLAQQRHSNSVARLPAVAALQGRVIGFARDKNGHQSILDYGVPEKNVYWAGHEGENLQEANDRFRDEPGTLVIAEDCRAFGDSKGAIADQISYYEHTGIRIVDLSNPSITTYSGFQQFAHQRIAGRRLQDKRKARRMGAWGGTAKGDAEEARRHCDGSAEKLLRAIALCDEISWRIKALLVEGVTSAATLRRKYLGAAS